MTIVRCTDCAFHNARMSTAGYDIIAIETYRWQDGVTETEILWGREEPPIEESEVPF